MATRDNLARALTNPAASESQVERVRARHHAPARVRLNAVSLWGCILLCAAVFWWLAGQGAKMDSANYRIDRLQSQIAQQQAENASLTTQVNSLEAPARILQIATQMGGKYESPTTIQVQSKY
ncbi:MAG: septum formation initiator family protein [Alicyclobacillus sp.]|nr:septum formation initiator family protein [Alicyclobacillus sp.]